MELKAEDLELSVKVYGLPTESDLEDYKFRSLAEIISMLGDKNEIWMGEPITFDLRKLSGISKQQLSVKLLSILENYDILITQFACSFRPASECSFVRATLGVTLETNDQQKAEAIAIDLYPKETYKPVTLKRTFSIKPSINLHFTKVTKADVSLFGKESSKEYLMYQPEISTYGLSSSSFGWDFNKTDPTPILGSRDLFALIKIPKGTHCSAKINMSALLQTRIGNIPLSTFFLSGSDKPIISKKYELK